MAENTGDKKQRFQGLRKTTAQIKQIYSLAKDHNPNIPWLLALAFLVPVALGILVGFLLKTYYFPVLLGIMIGLIIAMIVLSRTAERSAYSSIEGQPGAAGAVLTSLRRGWITEEQPCAVDPKSQSMVFRAIGKPGVVLVGEGSRGQKLLKEQERFTNRIVPNVPVHSYLAGTGQDRTALREIPKLVGKLKGQITSAEVSQVNKRLATMSKNALPIPKGVDPMKTRPDRKGMR